MYRCVVATLACPSKLLYRSDVGSPFKQMRRERMPQGVRGDPPPRQQPVRHIVPPSYGYRVALKGFFLRLKKSLGTLPGDMTVVPAFR